MRVYEVQPGDSPGSIAAVFAGCPRCSRDLLAVNHKPTDIFPNGYETFRELRVGERLNLPDKWWSQEFDERPRAYFAALPHADGVTPSTLGDAAKGVLSDYATLDAASASVNALPQMDIPAFSDAVEPAAVLIDRSVGEVSANSTAMESAQEAQASTAWARARNAELIEALRSGNEEEVASARSGIQNVLSTALDGARAALKAFYGSTAQPVTTPASLQPVPSTPFPTNVVAAAQAAVEFIAADPSYCASVARPGTLVNVAVHAFKSAWNGSQTPPVPIGTGGYEQSTADALARVLGAAPAACVALAAPQSTLPSPSLLAVVTPPQKQGLSTGEIFGIGLLGAGAVGGAIYLATREPAARVRRVPGE